MCSALNVREFITQRLAAAAEEIFGVFEKTVIQYEEELDRQRRMMETSWKTLNPQKPADLPQKHVHPEQEELPAEPLEPEPPRIKQEQDEACSSLQTEQLQPKEESNTFLVALLYGEGETRVAEETSDGLQRRHQEGGEDVDLGSTKTEQVGHEGPDDGGSEIINRDVDPVSDTQSVSQARRVAIKCDICGKGFRKKYHLKMHRMSHTGVKPYVCNECGKGFKAAAALREHMRKHTGEKPYACQTCGKTFRCSYSMLVHMRTHTGEKPYLCNTCGKRFTNSSAYKWHTAIHMGDRRYSCQVCGKSFTQSGNMKAHMRTHTGEKKHCCKTCGKRFSRSNSLVVHIRTHTGEKPYACSTCGERFQYGATLKKHAATHSGSNYTSG